LDVGVDVAVVYWRANYDGVGILDIQEGDIASVSVDNVTVYGAVGMVFDV
jgi:hypothetical protein